MTRRAATTIGPSTRAEALMTSGAASYVELEQFTRVLFRAAADVSLTPGAHRVAKEEYAGHMTTKIRCLHAPLRSRSALLVKAEKGNRIKQAGYAPGSSWHLRHWAGMDEERLVDQEWSANSYDENEGRSAWPVCQLQRRMTRRSGCWLLRGSRVVCHTVRSRLKALTRNSHQLHEIRASRPRAHSHNARRPRTHRLRPSSPRRPAAPERGAGRHRSLAC